MKIGIIDNIQQDKEQLALIITKWFKARGAQVQIFSSVDTEDFLAEHANEPVDLLFLDATAGETIGIDGLKTIRSLNWRLPIIFTSNSKEYLSQAVKCHIFDYIQKPYHPSEVLPLLEDVAAVFSIDFPNQALKFTCGKKKVHLQTSDIMYFTSDNNYTVFQTKNGTYKYRIFFSKVSSLLTDKRFIVCTRGVAVNMEYIKKEENGIFEMKDGRCFPIRRVDRKKIIGIFQEYRKKEERTLTYQMETEE